MTYQNRLVDWVGNLNAIITPFAKDLSVDTKAFRDNIEFLIQEGIDGIVACGCTGEFWSLTDTERAALFREAKSQAKGRVPVIGHVSHLMYQNMLELARAAQEAGLDGVMATPPYAALPNEAEVTGHFELLAQATRLPILIYNVPKRHGYNLSPAFLARLAEIPGVAGIKQSSNDFMDVVETVRLVAGKVRVLVGRSITRGFPAKMMGVDGFVSSDDPQLMGREAVRLYTLAAEGRLTDALDLQQRCIAINKAIHDSLGTPPAALKAAMNMMGRNGGYPRPPILPLDGAQTARLREILETYGLVG